MRRSVRRLGIGLVALVWIGVMALPILAFLLAARGELMIGRDQGSNLRLFMVNEDGAEGIGLQHVTKFGSEQGCWQTSVRYLLWEGRGAEFRNDFCVCYDLETGYVDSTKTCQDQ